MFLNILKLVIGKNIDYLLPFLKKLNIAWDKNVHSYWLDTATYCWVRYWKNIDYPLPFWKLNIAWDKNAHSYWLLTFYQKKFLILPFFTPFVQQMNKKIFLKICGKKSPNHISSIPKNFGRVCFFDWTLEKIVGFNAFFET